MFVVTKQAVLFRNSDGERFQIPNGYMGAVPEWVSKTRQFAHLVSDGKIIVSQGASDKEISKAQARKTKE